MSSGEANELAGRLAFYLLKKVDKTIRDRQLIQDGDRVAVAVSGGKDSLSLLRLLQVRQRHSRERYDLIALHVRNETRTDGGEGPELLRAWLQGEGVEHHFLGMDISEDESLPLTCFRCSWYRRKALFRAAHRLGCTKVAMGHHADDAAHTALLNLFHHGRLETIEPRRVFFDGLVTLIRPLIDVPEKELVRFARACGFPTQGGCCAYGLVSRRQKMRELLRSVLEDDPRARVNVLRAVERCRVSAPTPAPPAHTMALPPEADHGEP